MIALKDYQQRVLGSLRDFLNHVSRGAPLSQAFHDVQLANNRPPAPYIPVVAAGLRPEMPYVCLRVPTGGGKTLLASHAVGLAKHELLRAERAVALWLVPSNTILDQTADALRDPRHHYRRALELSCAGPVEVATIDEALRLFHGTVTGNTVVIVATIQSFRVEDSKDELKDAKDIGTAKSKVRFIITVEKLREGWDCPFAYVLCSLKETRSATAIEQIVGRILRLPGVKAKQHPDLNCAYAFSISPSIHEVLAELRDALESNGFTAAEAERIIIPVAQGSLALGAQPRTVTLEPGKEMDVVVAQTQVAALGGKVRLNANTGALTIFVPLDEEETEKLTSCATTPEAKQKVTEAVALVREAERAFGGSGATRQPSPYELQLDFIVPLLCVREDGQLFEFESTFLLEHPWKLSAKDAALPAAYNPLQRPTGKAGLVDIGAKGEVQTSVVAETPDADFVGTLHQQVLQLSGGGDWTAETLIAWIDKRIDHADIPFGESAEFLRKVLNGLMAQHGVTDVSVLALDRFRLRDEVEQRIQEHRESERTAAFNGWLLPESALTVSDERALNFKTMTYEPGWLYEGGFQFKKHYFGPKPGELREKRADGEQTEEFKCAQFLDGLIPYF